MNTFTLGFQKYFMINSFRFLIHFNSSLFFSDKNYTVVIERIFIWYQRKKRLVRVFLFFGPQAPAPVPGPRSPLTFLRPQAQITFSRPLMMELRFHSPPAPKITFSRPLVTNVCHVFSTPLNKTPTRAYWKILLSKKSYHT